MTTEQEVARIAEGLHPEDRAAILSVGDDPHLVSGSVASLLTLCLDGLADTRPDNSVALTDRGVAVRDHLKGNPQP